MTLYKIIIGGVDGTTHYEMGSDDPMKLAEFLGRYDHEGSTVALETYRDGNLLFEVLHGEEAYKKMAELTS